MLKTVNTYLKKQQRKQNTSVTLFMPKGPHYDRDKAQFPVTSKKMIFFFFTFYKFFEIIFKKITFSKPSESSPWGTEVKWLDFPSSESKLCN